MSDCVYRVDYKTKAGWRPYFTAETPEAAKAYLAIWQEKPLKWYDCYGIEMARERMRGGKFRTLRIKRSQFVTMGEVREIAGRKKAREASSEVKT